MIIIIVFWAPSVHVVNLADLKKVVNIEGIWANKTWSRWHELALLYFFAIKLELKLFPKIVLDVGDLF